MGVREEVLLGERKNLNCDVTKMEIPAHLWNEVVVSGTGMAFKCHPKFQARVSLLCSAH